MISSPLIDDRSRRHQSRCSITSNTAGRNPALNSTPRAAPLPSSTAQPVITPLRLHLKLATNRSLRPPHVAIFSSHTAAKSP